MSDHPNRAEAIAQIRAQGGYERATDDQIAGTMACAFLELQLAVRDIEGFRAHMIRAHGLEAPDDALEFALARARSYSGSEAGVYAVAAKWVKEAADENER